MYLSFYFIW